MIREYALVLIGAITLLFAGVAAYGVVFTNKNEQTGIDPSSIPDYSDELKSLDYSGEIKSMNAQIQDMRGQLGALQELKSNVSQIQQKLSNIEEKASVAPTPSPAPAPQAMAVILDKSTYQKGDTIKITAIGADPQTAANVQILDNDFVIVNKEAFSDSSGKLVYQLQLSQALPAGAYSIRVISGQSMASEPIIVQDNESSSESTTSQSGFTAHTDKSTYDGGDLIQVSGNGNPGQPISATLRGPSDQTYSTSATVQSDGTYTIFFPTTSSSESGKWYVTVNYLSQSIVVSVTIN